MASLKMAYRIAQDYAKDAQLKQVLEVASGWIFTFAADGQKDGNPVCYVSREGEAGPLFLPEHMDEMMQGVALTKQQIQELTNKSSNQ